MNTDKITQDEMVKMFGEAMPIEAVNLIWNGPEDMTVAECRAKLREIAAKRAMDASSVLSCPFCGSEGHTLLRGFRYPEGSSIKEPAVNCPTCGCQGPEESWNKRAR